MRAKIVLIYINNKGDQLFVFIHLFHQHFSCSTKKIVRETKN